MADPQISKFVKEYMYDEIIPTIKLPHDDMVNFANSVCDRYANPFVHHELMSIALNHFTKFKTRNLQVVLDNLTTLNHFPTHVLFSLAALIAFYRGKRGNEDIKLQDNPEYLEFFKNLWKNTDDSIESYREIVTKVLGYKEHWDVDLNTFPYVTDFVTDSLYLIETKGMREALKEKVGC